MNSIQGKGKRRKASQNKTANKKQGNTKPSKSLGRTILETIGGAAGNLVGLKDLGRDAGAWVSKVTGLGEYKINSNVFARSSEDIPIFEFNKDGSVIITHKEMVQDIVGSVSFTSQYFDIHPLNPRLFPWLSIEALGYEQFEFLGLLACHNSTCGDAVSSSNNSLGTVIFSTEYDVSRPAFLSKSDMDSYMFTTAKKPNISFIHPIECNPRMDIINARYNNNYFRQQAASTFQNPTSFTSNVAENLQCLGRLQVSTQGMQTTNTVGELWVTYKVKLSKTRAPPPGLTGGYFHAGSNNFGVLTAGNLPLQAPSIMSDSTYQTDTIGLIPFGLPGGGQTITLSGLRPRTVINVTYIARSTAGTSPTFDMGVPTLSASVIEISTPYSGNSGSFTANYCMTRQYIIGDDPYSVSPTITLPAITIAGSGAIFKWELLIQLTGNNIVPSAPLLSMTEKSIVLDKMLSHLTTQPRYIRIEEHKDPVDRVSPISSF